MNDDNIEIEIIYAEPNDQITITKQTASNCTLMQAVEESGILEQIDLKYKDKLKFGIYGNLVTKPNEYILQNGDRIEIYRPLLADPKKIRLQRLAKLKQDNNN
jgi:putative ubiquitin-RnfH superfamily antitoxin RatB of RatAB toxin-antitoxin module